MSLFQTKLEFEAALVLQNTVLDETLYVGTPRSLVEPLSLRGIAIGDPTPLARDLEIWSDRLPKRTWDAVFAFVTNPTTVIGERTEVLTALRAIAITQVDLPRRLRAEAALGIESEAE